MAMVKNRLLAIRYGVLFAEHRQCFVLFCFCVFKYRGVVVQVMERIRNHNSG